MVTFRALVENGKAKHYNLPALNQEIARHEGREIEIRISRGPKTQDQMGYYRSVVLPEFAREYGEDSLDAMHYTLKSEFLPKQEQVNHITGEILYRVPSLADLTIEEFSGFLDAVIRQAAINGWPITPPRLS
jgi:hypothetical protein